MSAATVGALVWVVAWTALTVGIGYKLGWWMRGRKRTRWGFEQCSSCKRFYEACLYRKPDGKILCEWCNMPDPGGRP